MPDASTIVSTADGKLEGTSENGVFVFRGVPYASPPVGDLRWCPPQPIAAWDGVRTATTFRPVSCQPETPPHDPPRSIVINSVLLVEGPQSEDCLYLNVWTPGLDDASRPVLVWIHGGGLQFGSGSQPNYDGTSLARDQDVVVVTINMRLGALGYLRLDELTNGQIPSTGNEGRMDEIAALTWVQRNIVAFGGDPQNVTIIGHSAGSIEVASLLAAVPARGLFHRAILHSTATHTAQDVDLSVSVARYLIEILGIDLTPESLRSVTPDELCRASLAIPARMKQDDPSAGRMTYNPVIDGEFLPMRPYDAIRNGAADGISIMVGTTLDETRIGLGTTPPVTFDEETIRSELAVYLGDEASRVMESYTKIRERRGVPSTPTDVWCAIETDRVVRYPSIKLSEALHERGNPGYQYIFTYESPAMDGRLRASHALELGFLFGTYDDPRVKIYGGEGPEVARLSARMQEAWCAFARTGDPSCESIGRWPQYRDDRETMLINIDWRVEEAPFDDERAFWESLPIDARFGRL